MAFRSKRPSVYSTTCGEDEFSPLMPTSPPGSNRGPWQDPSRAGGHSHGRRETSDGLAGTAIAHNSAVTHSQTKLLQCGLSCMLQWGRQRFAGLSGHLPHHATIAETAAILDSWSAQLEGCFRGLLGWDANETFVLHTVNKMLTSQTARGEHILNWLAARNLDTPEQQLDKPTTPGCSLAASTTSTPRTLRPAGEQFYANETLQARTTSRSTSACRPCHAGPRESMDQSRGESAGCDEVMWSKNCWPKASLINKATRCRT